ncbi:response regulator [Fibrobacterota bacterium]
MSTSNNGNTIKILLIEDNPGDIRLTREALTEAEFPNSLMVLDDGEKALDYLNKTGEYASMDTPDLILLDLNLPKKSGHEILSAVKADSELKKIPVVILTGSSREKDILESYNSYANCYIVKPTNIEQFIEMIRETGTFWSSVVESAPKH